MIEPLASIPASFRRHVALLGVDIMEQATSVGKGRWGLTPRPPDGFRVNVGWTEILTAASEGIRLIVDGERAGSAVLPENVSLISDEDPEGYLSSVPGSVLAKISYESPANFERAIEALRPAWAEAVRLAARRSASSTVKRGHRQEAAIALASLIGKRAPVPAYFLEPEALSSDIDPELMEGAPAQVVSSAYERNPWARRKCIEHYGTSCSVCKFSFESAFGSLGRGFIHVHHLVPMSSRGTEHHINPIDDLRPVCPNCHEMLHRRDPPLSIEELQQHLSRANDA